MQSLMSWSWGLPLAGGVLIGLASWLLLASLGRVAGISGIAASALAREPGSGWRWAFLAGLIGGGWWLHDLLPMAGIASEATSVAAVSAPVLIVAGLAVGAGTVIGSGCTSGHGVCGLGRRSLRSLVATGIFMGVAMVTVYATNSVAN